MTTGYSGKDVQAFLEYLADKGLAKAGTMQARRIAVGRVMETVGEEEFSDVRKIDVEHIMQRFHNLEGAKFTPESLRTYKSRVSTAIADFLRYKENPAGFKMAGQRTTRKPAEPQRPKADAVKADPQEMPVEAAPLDKKAALVDALDLPIPIRTDVVVRVSGLPHDLKSAEAQKIANVIVAMAIIEE